MKKLIPRLFILTVLLGCANVYADDAARPVALSADGRAVLECASGDFGLRLRDMNSSDSVPLVSNDYACYYGSFSADGSRVGYKDYVPSDNGSLLQVPSVYLRDTGRVIRLSSPTAVAGNPSFGGSDAIAWTCGEALFVSRIDADGTLAAPRQKSLGFIANHCAVSPDGSRVVVISPTGDVYVVVPDADTMRRCGHVDGGFAPVFSPSGERVLVTTSRGDMAVVAIATGDVTTIRRSCMGAPEACWLGDDAVGFSQYESNGDVTARTQRVRVDVNSMTTHSLFSRNFDARIVTNTKGDAAVANSAEIARASRALRNTRAQQPMAPTGTPTKSNGKVTVGTSVYFTGLIPYLNQVYDSLDSFSGGHSCCGSVASIMATQYYWKLPPKPTVTSRGGSHISYWGSYISDIFTINGKTFNAASSTAWGNNSAGYYGVFGWFLQDSNASSLGRSKRLAEFISACGLTSSCDDSVSGETGITKARTEIDNEYPFVVLNSITSSGHYTTCMGYVKNQHTLIFYDPYGNKNISYPSKDGRLAYYDTPGHNNGYMNLNSVWRFIYARGSNPTSLTLSATSSVLNAGKSVQVNAVATMNKGGSRTINTAVTWGSSNTSVATVSESGVVTGSGSLTKDSTANICANYQNFTAVYPVTVRANANITDWNEQ